MEETALGKLSISAQIAKSVLELPKTWLNKIVTNAKQTCVKGQSLFGQRWLKDTSMDMIIIKNRLSMHM